jgi:hypothetical protein
VRDPNWLYSTTAQCTAALVAIIGGFLVSRVVSIASSREALERRLREVRSDLVPVVRSHDEVLAEILADDTESFLYDAQDQLVEGVLRGWEPDAEELIEAGIDPGGRSAAEYQPAIAEQVDKVQEALGHVRQLTEDQWPSDADEMRAATGVEIDDRDAWIWKRLLKERNRVRRDPFGIAERLFPALDIPDLSHLRLSGAGSPAGTAGPSAEQEERALSAQREALTTRQTQLEEELADLRDTASLVEPIFVLSGFALVGLVLPLALLALDPVPTSPWMRGAVVLLFTAGLVMLVRYFVLEVTRLQRSRIDDSEGPVV